MKPDLSHSPVAEPTLPNSEQHTTSAEYMNERESVCDRHELIVL